MSSNGALDSLERALDAAPAPVTFFFRDDDGGWDDARLLALLDAHAEHGVPIDLALIPDAVGPALVAELTRRVGRGDAVGLHQHGRAHVNHEPAGRKCEFGPARLAVDQYTDIEAGKLRLAQCFGAAVDPIFTPPWNRCTQVTVVSLAALGFAALSRDRGAEALDTHGLAEVPVSIDWCGRPPARPTLPDLAERGARAARRGAPVGIMIHHAVMDDESRAELGALLALLARHPHARCARMRELYPAAPRRARAQEGRR
jgi:hypothetical protein